MIVDEQAAETSTAEVTEAPVIEQAAPSEPLDLSKLTPTQVRTWKETGKLPEPAKKTDPASVAAEGATPPAKVEAKPSAESAPAKPKKPAEDRVQQLLVDRARERQEAQRLREENAALKAGTKAPEPVKAAEPVGRPKFPVRGDYEHLDDYEKAMVDYAEALTDYKIDEKSKADQERSQKEQRDQYEAEVMAGWEERFETAFDAHPNSKEFEVHVSQAAEVFRNSPGIAEYIMTNEYGPQIAELLGKDLKRAHGLLKITNSTKLADALADLKYEARAGRPQSSPAIPAPSAAALPAKPKPHVETSPPPRELSTASTGSADVKASLSARMAKGGTDGDAAFAQWKQIRNDEDQARMRRR